MRKTAGSELGHCRGVNTDVSDDGPGALLARIRGLEPAARVRQPIFGVGEHVGMPFDGLRY
ncbi:hypothetical protein D3C72_1981670 [compost metagenome]